MKIEYRARKCTRCGGAGGADAWKYTGWTCYRCGGSGVDPKPERVVIRTPEEQARLEARRAKAAAKKEAARQQIVAANLTREDVCRALNVATARGYHATGFIGDIVDWIDRIALTDDQLNAFVAAVTEREEADRKRAEERAKIANAPNGRVVVDGVVLKTDSRHGAFGLEWHLLVKDQTGFRVWLTWPNAYRGDVGDPIKVKVTVTPSDDDPTFGFGKRPVLVKEGAQA